MFRMLWVSTGDVIAPFECWPTSTLPQTCALCRCRSTPFLSEIYPLLWAGSVLWYCRRCSVLHPALGERFRQQGETEGSWALLTRLFPRFDVTAAPGEEWRS